MFSCCTQEGISRPSFNMVKAGAVVMEQFSILITKIIIYNLPFSIPVRNFVTRRDFLLKIKMSRMLHFIFCVKDTQYVREPSPKLPIFSKILQDVLSILLFCSIGLCCFLLWAEKTFIQTHKI